MSKLEEKLTAEDPSTGLVVDGRLLFMVCFVLVHLAIASQVYWLSKDILYGDGSCEELTVPLRYPPMRVPTTPITRQFQAQGRLGADFAQIYFPSQNRAAVRDAYAVETTVDPWSRPSRYPPLIHRICAHTLCLLPYGEACLAHLAVQLLIFIGSFVFVFSRLGFKKYLLPALLLLDVCLFLTPVGLSFLERGQFTLYVGACYLWLMQALVTGKLRHIALSALFGFVKWTAFPFVFVVLGTRVLMAKKTEDFKLRSIAALVFLFVVVALLLPVPQDTVSFLQGVLKQESEMTSLAMGNALVRLVPWYVVKLIPLALVVIGASSRFRKIPLPYPAPFFAGSATILVTYPTFAYDYSVPYLTAFIPFLIYWATLPGIDAAVSRGIQWLFYAFLLLASFAMFIFNDSETMVIAIYLIAGTALIGIPLLNDLRVHKPVLG
jgi:hypothetical protein